MKSNKKVTIILPCYVPDEEVREHTENCLDNLLKYTDQSLFDLIVIENGSSEVPNAIPHAWGFVYQYVWTEKPIGYARAVNIGLKVVDTEFVCIINNDLFVERGWLEHMIADYESIPNCGILAPNGPPGITFDSHWWSCVLMRNSVVNAIGLLDEEKLNYRYHDQDMNIRIRKAGYQVARTGNVQMGHVNSATYNRMKRDDSAEREEMIRRHGAAEYEEWLRR